MTSTIWPSTTFEEVAHLLVHGALPTHRNSRPTSTKLKRLRGLPAIVQDALEMLPFPPTRIRWM
jgi:2-methylcitrate synthase